MIIIHFNEVHDDILINQCGIYMAKTGFLMLIMLIKIN